MTERCPTRGVNIVMLARGGSGRAEEVDGISDGARQSGSKIFASMKGTGKLSVVDLYNLCPISQNSLAS